jgi:hypothetical protein
VIHVHWCCLPPSLVGTQRKLSLAIALINDPPVCLLDEARGLTATVVGVGTAVM